MKNKRIILCLFFLFTSSVLIAQIDLTTGISGTTTGVGQSFNETRGIDVTVLSPFDVQLTAMSLSHFFSGNDGMAIIGARIYNSSTFALLFSHDTTVYSVYNGTINMPVSYVLNSGQSYRLGFYCSGNNSDNSALMFQPSLFPYIENKNILRINQAYSIAADAFPAYINIFVPFVSLAYDTLSVNGIPGNNLFSEINLSPGSGGNFLNLTLNHTYTNITVEVMNVYGQLLSVQSEAVADHFKIMLSGLAKGIYFVRINANGKAAVLKFMKE